MDPTQLMQALYLHFRHSMAGGTCKEKEKSHCFHPGAFTEAADWCWDWEDYLQWCDMLVLVLNGEKLHWDLQTPVFYADKWQVLGVWQEQEGRVISVVCHQSWKITSKTVVVKKKQHFCSVPSALTHFVLLTPVRPSGSLMMLLPFIHSLRLCICPDALK